MASAYPTAADLATYLAGHGFTLTAGQTTLCTTAIAAAIADFERRTDRKPMLSTTSSAKQYDPPTQRIEGRSVLFLRRDLASLTSVVYQPTGSSATTLTEGTDFDLVGYDQRDTDVNGPYDRIAFYTYRWKEPLAYSLRKSLTVTGKFAYHDTVLPDDVFLALLAGGAVGMGNPLTYSLTGGRLSFKDDDVSEDFGIEPAKNLIAGWSAQFEQAIKNYRRFSI